MPPCQWSSLCEALRCPPAHWAVSARLWGARRATLISHSFVSRQWLRAKRAPMALPPLCWVQMSPSGAGQQTTPRAQRSWSTALSSSESPSRCATAAPPGAHKSRGERRSLRHCSAALPLSALVSRPGATLCALPLCLAPAWCFSRGADSLWPWSAGGVGVLMWRLSALPRRRRAPSRSSTRRGRSATASGCAASRSAPSRNG